MENKNNVLVVAILTLILGLLLGYFAGSARALSYSPFSQSSASMMASGMHGAMSGMMMGLEGKTGDALDLAFLDGMIIHHEGAVEMAKALLSGTKRPELQKLGQDIISAQTGEIKMMQEWRKSWFGK